jgi:hypothetical protein
MSTQINYLRKSPSWKATNVSVFKKWRTIRGNLIFFSRRLRKGPSHAILLTHMFLIISIEIFVAFTKWFSLVEFSSGVYFLQSGPQYLYEKWPDFLKKNSGWDTNIVVV